MFKIAPVIFLAVLTASLFSPYLFFGRMPSSEESIGIFYPAAFFYQNAIESGKPFLWDSFYYGGFPAYLNVLDGFLYPLHYIIFKFLPLFTAYHIAMVIPIFLGMMFSYLFGRANSFSKIGALIFALSYTLGQTISGLDTALSYANGFMVLPLLLFSVVKAVRAPAIKNSMPFFLLGIAGATAAFLAGFQQTVLYGITFAFFYTLFLDWSRQETGGFFRRFRSTLSLITMVGIGAVLASYQLVSTFAYLDVSVRMPGYTADVFTRPPLLSYFVSFFFPDYFEIPFLAGGVPGIYIGVLPLIFSFAAVIFFRARVVLFFLLSYTFIFAMAVGLPGIAWINNNLPIFSRISDPGRWFIIGAFPLSFLAALGYEELSRQNSDWFNGRTFKLFLKTLGIFISSVFLFVAAANIVISIILSNPELKARILDSLLRGRALNFPYDHYRVIFDSALVSAGSSISIFHWEFLLPLLLFPASFFLLKCLSRKPSAVWFPPVALFLVSANICISFTAYFKELIPSSLILKEPAVAFAIKKRENDLKTFRFIPFLTGEAVFREISSKKNLSAEERALINREIMANQIGTFYGLQSMHGYEALRTLRSNQLLDTVLAPNLMSVFDAEAAKRGGRINQKVNNEVLRPIPLEEKKRDFLNRLGLLSMMNVKYVISLYPLKDERLEEIKIPAGGIMPLSIYLYENKEVMPRVYFSANPVFWNGGERDLLVKISETENFNKTTFIECAGCAVSAGVAGWNKINIDKYADGELLLKVESEKGGWLVFSESNIPGWTAMIDAARVEIYPANYLFQSVYIPAGAHAVQFKYVGPLKVELDKLKNSSLIF